MSKLRFVLDTNILISSILTKNTPPQQTFDYCIAHGTILLSDSTLEEISTVIMRKKFDRYASLAKRINFLQVLNDRAEIVTIVESITACRDRFHRYLIEAQELRQMGDYGKSNEVTLEKAAEQITYAEEFLEVFDQREN
jgi:putative PIN family toxin of toxin-antitoxin system